jgi:hypothetical protein
MTMPVPMAAATSRWTRRAWAASLTWWLRGIAVPSSGGQGEVAVAQ